MSQENYDLYEYARKRINQKKRLYLHFVLFCVGCLFMFIIDRWIYTTGWADWNIWASVAWAFLLVLHLIKVFITDRFMNKNWEREQTQRLVEMQQRKLKQIEERLPKNNPETQ